MRLSLVSEQWKERLSMLCRLPFSNKALRLFPPNFIFRDPVLSLVKQYRKQGTSCGLILLYLENFHHLFATSSYSSTTVLQKRIRQTLLELLPVYFNTGDVLGIRQYSAEDFCLFVREYPGFGFEDLQNKSRQMLKELELRLRQKPHESGIEPAVFQSGCYVIGQDIEHTADAIQSAYHYARCIATKKLPPHFSQTREQLANIVRQGDISVLAQPIMNLSTGELFGWEILTRGPRNTPFHTPSELFDMAYQADMLTQLELLVMRRAMEEIAARHLQEQVFINVTPVSLGHPLFLKRLEELLEQFPAVLPSQIVLEITERHPIRDFEHMGSIMAAFRAKGFRFAVDDAGAGYSSLQSITELIPDIIKIDKSVISNIDQMLVKQSLLRALLHFAENINCQVIAEGVERQEEASMLYDMRVNMVQGFYFARPQPIVAGEERVEQLLQVKEKIDRHRHVQPA